MNQQMNQNGPMQQAAPPPQSYNPPPNPQGFMPPPNGMYATRPVVNQPMQRPTAPITKTERLFAVITLVLGFFFVRFVLANCLSLFTTLFFIALTVATMIYLRCKNVPFKGDTIFGAFFLGLFSTVFIFNTNAFITFLATVFLMVGNGYLAFHATSDSKGIEQFLFYALNKTVFEYGFSNFDTFFKNAKSHKEKKPNGEIKKHEGLGKNILYIIIGLVIAFPLTIIVCGLLISADSQLAELLHKIFNFSLEQIFVVGVQLLLAIPVAAYIFSGLFSAATKFRITPYSDERYLAGLKKARFTPNMIIYAAVTPISLLYILFFFSQLNYFISAFMGKTADGLIYSEFAREGFFELCFVAIINLAVLMFMSYCSKQTGEEKPVALRIFSGFLALSTIVIIISALSKMYLYIDEYGLTQSRIYASWFMITLGMIFLVIFFRQFMKKFAIMKPCFYIVTAMFTLLCFARTDALIVDYNVNKYLTGQIEELDTSMFFYELSDDGLAAMLRHKDTIEEECGSKLYYNIKDRQIDYRDDYYEKLTFSGFMIAVQDLETLKQD